MKHWAGTTVHGPPSDLAASPVARRPPSPANFVTPTVAYTPAARSSADTDPRQSSPAAAPPALGTRADQCAGSFVIAADRWRLNHSVSASSAANFLASAISNALSPRSSAGLVTPAADQFLGRLPEQPVLAIDFPVQFLLYRNHLAADPLPLGASRIKVRPRRDRFSSYRRRRYPMKLCREPVQSCSQFDRCAVRQRELLDLCRIELIEIFPGHCSLARTMRIDRASFAVAYLLQPEASRGGVQEPEKPHMIILRRLCRKLYHRGCLLENLAAPIQHEVVMSRYFCPGYRPPMRSRIKRYLMPLIPRASLL